MNSIIATGHVMRCLAIADAAKKAGKNTTFILADKQAIEVIHERGYQTIILNTKWNDMDAELEILLKIIDRERIEVLLIDSYQVTQNYLSVLSKWIKTIYIDDLNKFIYPVHTLVCYVNYWKKFNYETIYCKKNLLLGTKFVPLRSEFKKCGKKYIRSYIENLLLLSGGTDNFHLLEGLLEKIKRKKYYRINVICGIYYNDYERLCKLYSQEENVYIYRSVNQIEEFMFVADMAISAGGTTLYELCACGVPSISYSFADNQLDNVRQFHEDGIIDYAGDVRYSDIYKNILELLNKYYDQPCLREERSYKMQKLIDGNGSERIVEKLVKISDEVEKRKI